MRIRECVVCHGEGEAATLTPDLPICCNGTERERERGYLYISQMYLKGCVCELNINLHFYEMSECIFETFPWILRKK